MADRPEPIALAVDDQFYLSRLALGVPGEAPPDQITRLFFEGLIERCGKRWTLMAAGRALLGDPMDGGGRAGSTVHLRGVGQTQHRPQGMVDHVAGQRMLADLREQGI